LVFPLLGLIRHLLGVPFTPFLYDLFLTVSYYLISYIKKYRPFSRFDYWGGCEYLL